MASSRTGSRPATLERLGAGQRLALEHGGALPDERQREMGERGEIAGRTDRATARHHGRDAPVEACEQKLDRLRPCAGVALRERVRAQQHRRAHDLPRIRAPTPHAWLRRSRSCSSSASSGGIVLDTNRPKPVLIPYVCSPELSAAARSTSSRAARKRSLPRSASSARPPRPRRPRRLVASGRPRSATRRS